MDYYHAIGLRPAPISGPLKIFQGGEFIGTVPGYPVVSTSFIFDVRPSDFKPVERGGETVLEAAWNIGPGDFRCLAGFRNKKNMPEEKGEMAAEFDVLVA